MARKTDTMESSVSLHEAVADRLDELNNAESLLDIIKLRPGDPSVELPPRPGPKYPPVRVFEKGNPGNAAIDEYRLQVRDALERNPQLFEKLLNRMTAIQRKFMVAVSESAMIMQACEKMAERHGETTIKWHNRWQCWPGEIKEAIIYGSKALTEDAINAALPLRRSYIAKAVMTFVDGLDSEDEKTRLDTAFKMLEMEFGKPGVRIQTAGDAKYDNLMERIAAAAEKAAGMPETIDGNVVDITPDTEGE